MKLQEVRESALALPLRSRAKLAKDLQQSLEEEILHAKPPRVLSADDPRSEAVIQARIDAYDRGELRTVSFEEFKKRVLSKAYAGAVGRKRKKRV